PAVVLALLRHAVLAAGGQLADPRQPGLVLWRDAVMLLEAQIHGQEGDGHDYADVGVQDARPDAAAEQRGQRPEGRVEEGQSGQGEQDEADADQPVVAAFGRRIPLQVASIAVHFAPSFSVSFSISSSTALGTSFGPLLMKWNRLPSATAAIATVA